MRIMGWVSSFVALLVGLYLWYMCICFFHLLHQAGHNTRRVHAAIARLPLSRWKGEEADAEAAESEPATCSICLGEFEEGQEIRILPCTHLYCRDCIDSWISRQGLAATCPLCKRNLVPREAYGDTPDADASSVHPLSAADAPLQPLLVADAPTPLPPAEPQPEVAQGLAAAAAGPSSENR